MTLKIAMIATGGIADTQLAPALGEAPGAQLWSVYSRDKARGDAFAARHGAASPDAAHDDLDALLADPELDAVLIASPDKLHADQTVRAAKAGKHILVEKPMATDRESAAAMIDAADKAGVVLAVAHHLRWHMGHRKLFEAARDGAFGTLRHMRLQWPTPARNADGWRAKSEVGRWWALAAVGTHCLDQIRWFMVPHCGEITRAESIINRKVYNGPHEETALLTYQFENGSTAELCASVLYKGPRVMELYGSDGYAICTETLGPHGGGRIETHEGSFDYTPANPYVGEIEDFAAAIRDGRQAEIDGREGGRQRRSAAEGGGRVIPQPTRARPESDVEHQATPPYFVCRCTYAVEGGCLASVSHLGIERQDRYRSRIPLLTSTFTRILSPHADASR